MTIKCAWCDKRMNETCPLCGASSEAIYASVAIRKSRGRGWRTFLVISALRLMRITSLHLCERGDCLMVLFVEGAGGTSYGICKSCEARVMEDVKTIPTSAAVNLV